MYSNFTALCSYVSRLCSHVSSMMPTSRFREACCRWEMTMLSLCVLAIAVSIATLVTPVAVPIMWNKIEGRAAAKGPVWTAPAVQEESDYQRSVRVRSCIRPLNAAVWPLALM